MVFCVSLMLALVLSHIFLIPYYTHVAASPDDYFNIIEVCHLALALRYSLFYIRHYPGA
jgi:hypothetical protein